MVIFLWLGLSINLWNFYRDLIHGIFRCVFANDMYESQSTPKRVDADSVVPHCWPVEAVNLFGKSEIFCGFFFPVSKICRKIAKIGKTKLRQSINSLKMHHSKVKCQKILDFSAKLFNTSWPLFATHCRIVSFQGLRLIVFAFSDNLSAENLNFLRSPDIQDIRF